MKIYTTSLFSASPRTIGGLIAAMLLLGLLAVGSARAATSPLLAPCATCHTTERICLDLDKDGNFWNATVQRMIDKGAHIGPDQVPDLVALLSAPDKAHTREVLGCPPPDAPTKAELSPALCMAHPALMALTLLLALWVAWQGVSRARFSLLGHKVAFNWKGHTLWGLVVMGLWLAGMAAGSIVTALVYGHAGVFGIHRSIAMAMLPLILFGAASGLYMDRAKRPRKLLPILHGVLNLVLLLLALGQLATGIAIVSYMLGQ